MVPGSQRRGSTSIETSAPASRVKRASSAAISSRSSSRDRKVGVPPPQCSWQMRLRPAPSSGAISANSLSKYLIYFADLARWRVTTLLQPQ